MTSGTWRPLMVALKKSGYWVAEWLPQMVMFFTAVTSTPALIANWLLARFSSKVVMAKKRSVGMPLALFMAIRAFVLQGLPTTKTLTSEAALFSTAFA